MTDSQYQDLGKDYLEHYGVLGMKWGVRRYQNADGTLTEAGKKRWEKRANKAGILGHMLERSLSMQELLNGVNKTRISKIKNDKTLTRGQKFAKRMVNIPGFEIDEVVAFKNADEIIRQMEKQGKDYKASIPKNAESLLSTFPWAGIAEEVAQRNGLNLSKPDDRARIAYVMMYWPQH